MTLEEIARVFRVAADSADSDADQLRQLAEKSEQRAEGYRELAQLLLEEELEKKEER